MVLKQVEQPQLLVLPQKNNRGKPLLFFCILISYLSSIISVVGNTTV